MALDWEKIERRWTQMLAFAVASRREANAWQRYRVPAGYADE
ncbi:hypothetical protein [Anabaena azotica]|nr:hypothetical protein [Anabaena azotica]